MNEKIKQIKKRKKSDKFKLNIMIFIFSVISFYTSYTGVIKLSGVSEYNIVLRGFMAVLIGGLQFALVYSINAFYIKDLIGRYWLKTLALISLYIITMSFSVIFSFSYWYESFSAENFAKRSADIQLMGAKNNLINAKESFSSISNNLLKLSNYSTEASNREKHFGRTCNPSVGAGEGVYTWLRADDATYTKEYSEEIQKLQSNLDKEINKVSNYIEEFDPNGNVEEFTRIVNGNINKINVSFFKNSIITDLKTMLLERSGKRRGYISVENKKTHSMSTQSCIDKDFTRGANKVIERIDALRVIEPLEFFNKSDTQKLFGRTVGVLKALIDPSVKIKKLNEITSHDDVTVEDINAVVVGFIIDFIILLITIIGKEEREALVPYHVVQDILNGKHSNEIWSKMKLYLAEMWFTDLIAIPNDVDSDEIDNMRQLILYFQQEKIAKLYINDIDVSRLNHYFRNELKSTYPNSSFRVYKLNKKKFNKFLLQNIEEGFYHV